MLAVVRSMLGCLRKMIVPWSRLQAGNGKRGEMFLHSKDVEMWMYLGKYHISSKTRCISEVLVGDERRMKRFGWRALRHQNGGTATPTSFGSKALS